MINSFIGIPWLKGGCTKEGADCWGLMLLVLNDVFNIPISAHKNSILDGDELTQAIINETYGRQWLSVIGDFKHGDIVIFAMGSHWDHIGMYLDGDSILHSYGTSKTGSSSVTKANVMFRIAKKFEVYRHASMS